MLILTEYMLYARHCAQDSRSTHLIFQHPCEVSNVIPTLQVRKRRNQKSNLPKITQPLKWHLPIILIIFGASEYQHDRESGDRFKQHILALATLPSLNFSSV